MTMLRGTVDGGYPLDYLLARIRGRRSGMIDQWGPLVAADNPLAAIPPGGVRGDVSNVTPEGLWRTLLHEYAWVHRQMDGAVREAFFPFFGWFGLRTLILCLRSRAARNAAKVEELMEFSLLSDRLKRILAREEDLHETVAALDAARPSLSLPFRGMEKALQAGGLAGLEQSMTDSWLRVQGRGGFQPLMAGFVGCLIDLRNLLHLHKRLRWETSGPEFLKGGCIGRQGLDEVLEERDRDGMALLLQRFPGGEGTVDPHGSPEQLLLRAVTHWVHRKAFDPSGYGLVLDYLWRWYTETVNLGILCHGAGMDREELAGELIL